ncbi:MAG: hypothetical protein ICV73_06225 [Acetobacteraceae bacterium]|nr:hypothetical protein [Acetobacteraceae bacterium]
MVPHLSAAAVSGASRGAAFVAAFAVLLAVAWPAGAAEEQGTPGAEAETAAPPAARAPASPAARPVPPREAPPAPAPRNAAAGQTAPQPAAAGPRPLRFCAGILTGNYTFAAERIAERARSGALDMEVVATPGAADNLRRLSANECDVALSQSDLFDLRSVEVPEAVRGIVPFKRVYTEYVHVLCPIASGLTGTSQFGPNTRLITGTEGSGASETWRAFRAAVPRLNGVQRIPDPVNLVAVNRVKESRDTCMLWVSGLNSSDMQGANAMSANTPDRRRTMRLVGVNEPVLRGARGSDGRPMYRFEPIRARFGSYDNLIDPVRDPESRALRPGAVMVPVVDAVIFAREDVLAALPDKGSGLVRAVEEAGPGIWARVSPPPPQQRAETPPGTRR